MEMLKFILVVAFIIGLHYVIWKKFYRDWFGNLKGLMKVMAFIFCLFIEGVVTVLLGIYVLSIP